MKTILSILLLGSLTAIGHAQPAADDGNQLIVECAHVNDDDMVPDPLNAFQQGRCLGLVRGVGIMLEATNRISRQHTIGQDVRVVNKYLQDHPEQLATPDAILVMRALTKAFPVQK